MSPVLGYWKIRGIGQPVRLLLNYLGVEFENKLYEQGDAPEYSKDCWRKEEQFSHGLDFPNLPYYIDGEVKITQSNAILRYIARKHALDGKTDQEKIRIDIIAEELTDFRMSLWGLVYCTYLTGGGKKFEDLVPDYVTRTADKLAQFEAFLGDKPWLAGDNITFVDFVMFEFLDQNVIMLPDVLKDFPKLTAFLSRFRELPAIKAYMKSDEFIERPLNNKTADFL